MLLNWQLHLMLVAEGQEEVGSARPMIFNMSTIHSAFGVALGIYLHIKPWNTYMLIVANP